jgi:hypothetical protein
MIAVRSIIPWLLGALLGILVGILSWSTWRGWRHAPENAAHDLQWSTFVWLLALAAVTGGIFVIYVMAR